MRAASGGGAILATVAALLLPGSAAAAVSAVFSGETISGQPIPCLAQGDGVRVCHGTDGGLSGPDLRLKSFDGQPLEAYVMLPPAPAGSDGNYPLIVQSHGYGGSAGGPEDSQFFGPTADTLAKEGYAVVQLSARGFGDSCGKATQKSSPVAFASTCTNGYVRLDDDRYEVRDIQYATGVLVDAGIADPAKIGLIGESYGGGVSLQLATLKDRVMMPDGSLVPWRSPNGTPLSIAAAVPVIPWSDLIYSLMPNGRTLDYQAPGPTTDFAPIGASKQSFVAGLFAEGQLSGTYVTPGLNPQADLTSWFAAINAGEPYEVNPEAGYVIDQLARYHSAYYLLDGAYGAGREAPPPLLIANGFSDDLFPVDEALRYYNLEHSLFPGDPISLFDGDFGHMRAQNKPDVRAALSQRIAAFLDYYLKGAGSQPASDFTAYTETCPKGAPSGGPYEASTWAGLHPGEVDLNGGKSQTIVSASGNPSIARTIDPVVGSGACATVPAIDQGGGVATYRLPRATGGGYTLLGSPTVVANLTVIGPHAEIAERLWDVDPASNTETLVARGVYRIDPAEPDGLQVFQLHPGAWHFAAGHVPKLELLGQDAPYVRASNTPFTITISGLSLRLPVHEVPGSAGTPPVVAKPKARIRAHPHPAPRCAAYPTSTLNRRSVRGTRRGLIASGSASETPCAGASPVARRRQHVARVYVSVYRGVGHGRCRFLLRSGALSRPRSCSAPIEFRARGTRRWILRLRERIATGKYQVRSDAVDATGHHQRRSARSASAIMIR
ncbi:MAG: S15 peptidase family protein [Solirubrobacteraceae bacterium]